MSQLLPIGVALAGVLLGSTPGMPEADGAPASFQERESVRLVLVPAIVTTRNGRPVRGVSPDEFQLEESRVRQEIAFVEAENRLPVSVAFALDVSGSMARQGKLDRARQVIRHFLEALEPGDRFGLIAFADDQVRWISEFGSDREHLLERLAVQRGFGPTALFDALAAAPRMVDAETRGRKAIILLTDGRDNASRMNTFRAVRLARSVSVPIYILGFDPVSFDYLPVEERVERTAILERFAEETGGRRFSVTDPKKLRKATRTIVSELRFQYVIGYYPTQTVWDGGFRRIRLSTTRKKLLVRARAGYYAHP